MMEHKLLFLLLRKEEAFIVKYVTVNNTIQ